MKDLEFPKIYEEFQRKILRYLIHLVGESEAEDLTQEVFIKADQALQDFRGDCQISTWLYRIATNTALDRLRSSSHEQTIKRCSTDEVQLENREPWTGEKTPLVENQIYHKEMKECLQGFIQRLPENYRVVLVLSEFEGLKNNEIAKILGTSLSTVKIRLHRAREKLKQDLLAKCDSYWVEDNEFLPELRIP